MQVVRAIVSWSACGRAHSFCFSLIFVFPCVFLLTTTPPTPVFSKLSGIADRVGTNDVCFVIGSRHSDPNAGTEIYEPSSEWFVLFCVCPANFFENISPKSSIFVFCRGFRICRKDSSRRVSAKSLHKVGPASVSQEVFPRKVPPRKVSKKQVQIMRVCPVQPDSELGV